MSFFNLIAKRRSIRKYRQQPIEPEKVAQILEAALRAPSSRGINPWQFIVVDEEETIRKLSDAKEHGSAFLKSAPLAIIVCAEAKKSDVWIEDASIASIYLILAAEAVGLGSCWIQIRERKHNLEQTSEEFLREALKIPQGIRVESIIAIGYSDERKIGHSRDKLQDEKVFKNRYGQR